MISKIGSYRSKYERAVADVRSRSAEILQAMGDYHLLLRVETGGDGRIDRVAQERGAVGVEEAARRVLAHDLGSLAFARVPAISATMRRPIDSSFRPLAQQRRVTAKGLWLIRTSASVQGGTGAKKPKKTVLAASQQIALIATYNTHHTRKQIRARGAARGALLDIRHSAALDGLRRDQPQTSGSN